MNVHIQHPPDAEVQIHQVARVQPGQRPGITEGAHSVQQRSQPGNGHEPVVIEHNGRYSHTNGNGNGNGNGNDHARSYNRQNGHVGRCFQETVDGQVLCSVVKALVCTLSSLPDPSHLGRSEPIVGVETSGRNSCFPHRRHYIHILSPSLSQTGSRPVGMISVVARIYELWLHRSSHVPPVFPTKACYELGWIQRTKFET